MALSIFVDVRKFTGVIFIQNPEYSLARQGQNAVSIWWKLGKEKSAVRGARIIGGSKWQFKKQS
jgi:hypothetical protein